MNTENVCALVLAGGRGERMGGADKGLQIFRGQPLVQHAVQRLQTQMPAAPGLVAINANRNLQTYQAFGMPVWPDANDDFAGPLAGFQTALTHLAALESTGRRFEYLLTVPCDSPLFPLDLLQRLLSALKGQDAEIAVAMACEIPAQGPTPLRPQPVFSLLHCSLINSLQNYLNSGQRKINAWFQQHRLAHVGFDLAQDDVNAFANANTLEELHTLERL